jgi:putative salt-induced outer membrane protein YdiY
MAIFLARFGSRRMFWPLKALSLLGQRLPFGWSVPPSYFQHPEARATLFGSIKQQVGEESMKVYSLRIMPLVVVAFLLAAVVAGQAQTNATRTNVTTTTTTNGNTITITTTAITTIIKTNAAAATTNANPWKSSISFGLTIARGNTDTAQASVTASTEKRWLQNDLTFAADGLYGETKAPNAPKNTENAETLHGFSQYNRFLGDGFYGYGRIDGFHDGIADIKYRLSLSPGLGYFFVTNKTVDLSGEIGPGYVKEQLGDNSESFATLRLEEKLHYRISPHARAWESVKILPQINRFDNYVVMAEVGIEAGLTTGNKLSLRSVLQDSYNNIPAAARLKNDLQIITSLVYRF